MGVRIMSILVLYILLSALWGCSRASVAEPFLKGYSEKILTPSLPRELPNVTESGYLPLAYGTKDALFYAYYTAQRALKSSKGVSGPPILVWLQVNCRLSSQDLAQRVHISFSSMQQCAMSTQGGPGCSSQLGNFYTLGPYKVNKSLMLEPNPGQQYPSFTRSRQCRVHLITTRPGVSCYSPLLYESLLECMSASQIAGTAQRLSMDTFCQRKPDCLHAGSWLDMVD